MRPGSFLNPPTCVLPFDMFRMFAPVFDKKWQSRRGHRRVTSMRPIRRSCLKMELPEMKKEDVHAALDKNVLTLRGERKFEETVNRESYYRIERKCGEFSRSFRLPSLIEGSKVVT